MVNKVLDYVKKYRMIEPEDTIVAGISGAQILSASFLCWQNCKKGFPLQSVWCMWTMVYGRKRRKMPAMSGSFAAGLIFPLPLWRKM